MMTTESPTAGQTWRHFNHTVRLVRRSILGGYSEAAPVAHNNPIMWECEILEGEPVEGEMTVFIAEDGLIDDGELVL